MKRAILASLAVAIIATGVAGLLLMRSRRSNDIPPVTTTTQATEETTGIMDLVLRSPVIIPSSIEGMTFDMNADGEDDVQVAFYNLDVDGKTRSGFRIYDVDGGLLYENQSSVWNVFHTRWSNAYLVDLGQDSNQELVLTGTQDGTGAYYDQEIFAFLSHVGFQKIEAVASKTNEELTQTFLEPNERLGNGWIGSDGLGHRAVCADAYCAARQSAPNAVGEIINTYTFEGMQYVETGYQRVDD